MKAYNAVTLVCVLIMLAAGIGSGYAYYSATLNDNETVTVENNYGTVVLTESEGVYTLSYQDTTADKVYLTVNISGLELPQGTIVDLWLGEENVISGFDSAYSTTVDGTALTALSRPLAHNDDSYTDGNATYTVTCRDDTVTVMKDDQELSVLMGMFYDDGRCYTVDASGNNVSSVSLMISINGSDGKYVFDDGGYRYIVTCSASSVTAAKRCIVVSSSVNNSGEAAFRSWTLNLTAKAWNDTVALYNGNSAVDLSTCEIDGVFYSTGGLS